MVYVDLDRSDDLTSALKRGLEVALYERDIQIGETSDWRKPNLVWINKLAYRAIVGISDHELPILYSWWRYGPAMPLPEIRPGNLSPRPSSDVDNLYESPDPVRDYPSAEQFRAFFVDVIETEGIFERDLYNYLEDVYNEDAPTIQTPGEGESQTIELDLGEMYLASLDIQRVLYNLHIKSEGEKMSESDVEAMRQIVRPASLTLKRDLNRWGVIPKNLERHVMSYLYLLEDALESLEEREKQLLDIDQIIAFQDLCSVYHGFVWRWVAYYISNETVDESKPGANQLINSNNECIERAGKSYPKRLKKVEESCCDADLTPVSQFKLLMENENLLNAVQSVDDATRY
jgi:hypothetical protein